MTEEREKELRAMVEESRRKAHVQARKLYAPNTGPTSPIVNEARLSVLETTLAGLMAERSTHPGTFEEQALLEMRDYWDAVAEDIKAT